ncbi:MAG: RelA/SpoT domain-containing protein, partial [Rhodospirillales bacterium]|nr:RelA/SpoT domain-containing protein [Rhodospirillales bacterium]
MTVIELTELSHRIVQSMEWSKSNMKLIDYETKYEAIYAEYAEIVKFILESAISEAVGISRPQSIQSRAKSVASLKDKLQARGLIESEAIEAEIKDLAGVRLIFYNNTDVDRFIGSGLISRNFEIDHNGVKIHHPVDENRKSRYQAIHFTVRLNEERVNLAEYAKFRGRRCEVQIQTILNHAWSETSHDIIYKNRPTDGFGKRAMKSITDRLDQIMDKYLLPAGNEFQRIQHDFNRWQQGKELFDRDALRSLGTAENNNERHELLSSIKEYVLPNYDDIPAIYGDLCDTLIVTAKKSRTSLSIPISTPFGDIKGKSAADVANIIVDIIDHYRYVSVETTFLALCSIYRDEIDSEVQGHILEVVKHLAHYNLDVCRKVGPQVQWVLMDIIAKLETEDLIALRPFLITVWREVLNSNPTGVEWTADAVTFSSGALPVSNMLKAIRDKAMSGLFDLFGKSASLTHKREIISALREATRVPTNVECSKDLLALTIIDTKKIVDYFIEQILDQPYELLEHLEHNFLFDYRRGREIAENENENGECRRFADALVKSITMFKEIVNADDQFVRFKTLVGYESVFPPSWDDDEFQISGADRYREECIKEYVVSITEKTEDQWIRLIELCATADSSDLVTFNFFYYFIYELSKAKPSVADNLLKRGDENILRFLTAFLDGLRDSGSNEKYNSILALHLEEGRRLGEIALHFRRAGAIDGFSVNMVLQKAFAGNDDRAVIECLILAIEKHDLNNCPLVPDIFVPAIKYLIDRGDSRWVNGAYYLPKGGDFFRSLSSDEVKLVLDSLEGLPKIGHQAEKILTDIAEVYPEAVWNFLGRRITAKREKNVGNLEPFPYRFHGLEGPLSTNAELAVKVVRTWFHERDNLFRFDGGHLLYAVFP